MAVESKKNETSAEKNVKKEAANGDEYVKLNGDHGELHTRHAGKRPCSLPLSEVPLAAYTLTQYVMCIHLLL